MKNCTVGNAQDCARVTGQLETGVVKISVFRFRARLLRLAVASSGIMPLLHREEELKVF